MVSLLASKYTFNITNIIIIINYIIFIILVIIMMEFLLAHGRVGCESTPRPVSLLGSSAIPSQSRRALLGQWRATSATRDIANQQHHQLLDRLDHSVRAVTGAGGKSGFSSRRIREGSFWPAGLLKELAGAVLVAQFKDRARWCDPACTRSGARRGAPPANQPLRQHQTSLLMMLPCRK